MHFDAVGGFKRKHIFKTERDFDMAKDRLLFVERRLPRRLRGAEIECGAGERHSSNSGGSRRAGKRLNPGKSPLVERVRDTDRGSRDKWRKP